MSEIICFDEVIAFLWYTDEEGFFFTLQFSIICDWITWEVHESIFETGNLLLPVNEDDSLKFFLELGVRLTTLEEFKDVLLGEVKLENPESFDSSDTSDEPDDIDDLSEALPLWSDDDEEGDDETTDAVRVDEVDDLDLNEQFDEVDDNDDCDIVSLGTSDEVCDAASLGTSEDIWEMTSLDTSNDGNSEESHKVSVDWSSNSDSISVLQWSTLLLQDNCELVIKV